MKNQRLQLKLHIAQKPHQTEYYYFKIKQKLIANITRCSKHLKSSNQWMHDFEITISERQTPTKLFVIAIHVTLVQIPSLIPLFPCLTKLTIVYTANGSKTHSSQYRIPHRMETDICRKPEQSLRPTKQSLLQIPEKETPYFSRLSR